MIASLTMATVATETKIENIILFDGVCNLCNTAINFVIDRDRKKVFKFSSFQSTFGQGYLKDNQLPLDEFEYMVYVENDKIYAKSTAALKIARKMSGIWPILYGFIIIPKFLRDAIYNLIANNRYKWFGKRDQCRVLTPELKARFLEQNDGKNRTTT